MASTLLDRVVAAENDPRVKAFLDMLAATEGTANIGDAGGYNVLFGGSTINDYSQHPNIRQTFGNNHVTSAAGRYQFTNATYNEFAEKMGITDFSPQSQDRVALGIVAQHNALDDILNGDIQSAMNKLGGRWASLPTSRYDQPKRSSDFAFNAYNTALEQHSNGDLQPSQYAATNVSPSLANRVYDPTNPLPGYRSTVGGVSPAALTDTSVGALLRPAGVPVPSSAIPQIPTDMGASMMGDVVETQLFSGLAPEQLASAFGFNQMGSNMLAIPESDRDQMLIAAATEAENVSLPQLMRIEQDIQNAKNTAATNTPLFDAYPQIFDDDLLALLDTVYVPTDYVS